MADRLIAASLVLLAGCEFGLNPSLARSMHPDESGRKGCRLDVQTQVATCPCALPADLAELPDREDLVALDTELADSSDASMLARLTHLRSLRTFNVSAPQLARIATLPQIEQLALTARGPIDFGTLAKMQKLRSIEIIAYGTQRVTAADLEPLASLPALVEIRLTGPFPRAGELEPMFPRAVVRVHAPENWGNCAITPESCPPPLACERPPA
ncbi:MAG TPA: hypothetical protein VIF62_00680 [Labilithrix sp.]